MDDIAVAARQQQLPRPFGTRLEVHRALQSLVNRGTQMLCIYTASAEKYYNYAGQFFDYVHRAGTARQN